MEGLANRVQPHMLQAQPNTAGPAHYGSISIQQTQADKMPPTYEEAQLAVQAVDIQQITNMEAEKQAIYRHPLLPLLAKLFEKCEQSTQTCESTPANAFDNEIKNGILQMNREGKPFYTDDRELDNLMVKAIQVLRIHLLELEKVNELCKDFCQRYIACLKGKMQSENLLRSPLQTTYSPAVNVLNASVQPQTPTTPIQAQPASFIPQQQQQQQLTYYTTSVMTPVTVANATPSASVIGTPLQQQVATVTYVPQGVAPGQQIVIAQVPQQVAQPVVQSTVAYSSVPTTVTYSSVPPAVTYVSSPAIETVTPPRPQTNSPGDESPTEITVPSSVPLPALDSPTEVTDKKRTRRGVLPKQATNIMKTWLFQHLVHPYPTEDEKRAIAAQTNLTILQVNNWFINARRRILQPMLDASNPEGPKAKKSKIQSRPAQRFWPENLVPSQFSTIPIAPAPVTVQAVMQGVQMQTVPHGTAVAVAPGATLPTTITIPNVQGATVIPGTVTLQQQTGTPTTMVVVTLPPSASHISTVTASESSSAVTTHPTMITPVVVSSQVESVSNLSPMYSNIQQGSPSLQNSPLPTMVQNGSMGSRESNLVGSPHHLPSSTVSIAGVQENLVGVTTISLDSAAVSRSLVN